ncbi:MAG: LysR family transcriptional regulator [Roseovarius sp.]
MKSSKLSLKWLDVFQQIARSGSVQKAAQATGLSLSTVSHHLKALEAELDCALFDHSKRPMRLTPRGAAFLREVDLGLAALHRAETQARAGDILGVRSLSLAMIEDFDSEIAPELALRLAASMPDCTFRHLTRPSHDILELVREGDADIGIAAKPQFDVPDVIETPLLRDPFVLALPISPKITAEACLAGDSPLPLLRYSREHIMGRQIEAQLSRLKRVLPNAYEFESNETIMSMVAGGSGWAITTPTNTIRSARFQRQIRLLPFPGKGFARSLSVFTPERPSSAVAGPVISTLRQLIQSRAIDPTVARMPWLKDGFCLADD